MHDSHVSSHEPDPTNPEGPITDPGVKVATGDPDKIDAAGGFHHAVAAKLEAHSALIKGTAGFLLNGWNGKASKEYKFVSEETSGHYEVTAAEAVAVGSALKKFASELGKSQGEGKTALKNAIHWMNEVNSWSKKEGELTPKVAAADKAVTTQMGVVVTARNAWVNNTDPKQDASLQVAYNNAKADLTTKRATLNDLQNQKTNASKQRYAAADHFTSWQKKGGAALQRAEQAAGVAGYALGVVSIASPPVAKAMNAVLDPQTGTHSWSHTWGLQGKGQAGGKLANGSYNYYVGANAQGSATGSISRDGISGDLKGSATVGAQGTAQGHLGWSQFGMDANATGTAGATASGELKDSAGINGLTVDNQASVFAGAEVSGTATQNVGPFSVSESGNLQAGAGAQAGEDVEITKTDVSFSFNLGASLGIGAGGGISVAFNPEAAVDDVKTGFDAVKNNAGHIASSGLHGAEHFGSSAVHDTGHVAKKILSIF